MSTAAVRRYWTQVADVGCLICQQPAEIAHAHGGSIVERGVQIGEDYSKAKGLKLAYMDWLVLPLCPNHHRLGSTALDRDVDAFERAYGPQAEFIDYLAVRFGLNLWQLARSRHSWAIHA